MTCRSRWVIAAGIVVLFTLLGGGCGDFMPSKGAGIESQRIIDDLGRVETRKDPDVPLPEIYKAPPKILEQQIGGAPEYKLFYFCQHHTSDELKTLVSTQFASKLFDAKGKSTRVVDYGVSSNPAINQLIVRCPAREDAEAVLEFLYEVDLPPIQIKIDCLISEVYADKTLDWETTLQIEDLLGEGISAQPSGTAFGEGITKLVEDGSIIPAFPGASLREVARSRMGLKVGYLSTSGKFLSLVDLLESQGYLKILMNPTLEVLNGKKASISSSQKVPIDKTFLHGFDSSRAYASRTEWENVVDSLEVTPHFFLDGSIGLETNILLGSKLTPEGIKQVSIITKKEVKNQQNRIRPGESLIIGGLRKSEKRDVIRGVPFLKDIPLLGILFSGRDFEERVVETVFILTPSISTGGIPREEMLEEVERKQGDGKKKQDVIQEAEKSRLEAEAEKAEARHVAREAEDQVKRAETKAEIAREIAAEAEKQAQTEVEKAKADAEKVKAEAETAKAEAKTATEKAAATEKQAQAQIEKLKAEAEKLTAEAEKAKADAQKATAEVEKAKADAQKATAEAEKAKADAQKATAEAEKAKADAEKAMAEAEAKTKAAEKAKAEAEAKAEAAEKARAEAERPKQEGEAKDKDEVQKLKAEAEKAKADAQRLMAEAEKAQAEAETKAKAAEKAKAEADAKAKAAEKAEAEKTEEEVAKKARAERDKADTQRNQRRKQEQPKRRIERPKRR